MPRYDYDLNDPNPKIRKRAEDYFGLKQKKVYKNPVEQANSIDLDEERSWGPRKPTVEDARKNTRYILANDRNNSVYEAYDDYLQRKGKPSLTQIGPDGKTIYPKGSWKTIVSDDEWLKEEVAPYLDPEYDFDVDEVDDEFIEKALAQNYGEYYK